MIDWIGQHGRGDVSDEGHWTEVLETLPPGAVLRRWEDALGTMLFPTEESAVSRAVPSRRLEFAKGRACARAAISALGFSPRPIPVGAGRGPMWPVGLVGSITHTDGLVMALAVRTSSVSTIGIDAEVRRPLPPEVVDLVLREEEQAEFDDPLQRLALFSAKEAIHKAVFPACGVWLDFRDVRLRLSDGGRAFDVVEASQSAPEMVSELVGRTVMLPGHVFTVCYRVAGGP